MWFTFAVILLALFLYASEILPLEVTSLGVICVLLVVFHLAPVTGPAAGGMEGGGAGMGEGGLTAGRLLAGFANPATLTVVALLVMGEGLNRSGLLDRGAGRLLSLSGGRPGLTVGLTFAAILMASGFLNNIPVVVIFIPVMQALARQFGQDPGKLLLPLSYAAILGGMTTLVGSSTNLLVSGVMVDNGLPAFGMFGFTIPGLALAGAGFVYILLLLPRLLPGRSPPQSGARPAGRQFVAEIAVESVAALHGMKARGGFFPELTDITVCAVRRGARTLLPPYDDDLELAAGDVLVVAAMRDRLTHVFGGRILPADTGGRGGRSVAEAMVTPNSRLIGQSLEQAGFRYRYGCEAMGIQRKSRMLRGAMRTVSPEAGDILLLAGPTDRIDALRGDPDILLMEWSATEMPAVHHALPAGLIFLAAIAIAATGLAPIVITATTGVLLMLLTGVLTPEQAARAIDRKVVLTIAAALALGVALQETGGAPWLAGAMLAALDGASPAAILSALFLLVAVLANLISTKAAAVLFTPIALEMAARLQVPPQPFAVAVVFAANCAFASPVGYQTNLLVIAPGHYRFTDFLRGGVPLTILTWLVFSLVVPRYYGI